MNTHYWQPPQQQEGYAVPVAAQPPAPTRGYEMPPQQQHQQHGVQQLNQHMHHINLQLGQHQTEHYTPDGVLRGIAAEDPRLQEHWQSYMAKVGSARMLHDA